MADVFISYSKKSPDATHALAATLNERGIDVWWDTGLLAGDLFVEALKSQLDAAKAVIVIWTPESVRSDWVLWEASIAFQQGKLITTKVSSPLFEIPEPFKRHQTIDVSALGDVVNALRKHGVETELTKEDMIAALAQRNPTTEAKIRAFFARCSDVNFKVESKKTLMLKLRAGNKNINFATIYPESGAVDASYVYNLCKQIGRAEVAEKYLLGLAALTGGEVLTNDGERRNQYVTANGSALRFDRLTADGGEHWLALLTAASAAILG